jgi:hypothetical protein
MQEFIIHTLVDISETIQLRKEPGREIEYQQQQNYLMLLQTISMRANPMQIKKPTVNTVLLKDFGSQFSGKHRVWSMKFAIEYQDAYTDSTGNEIGALISDINFVPVSINLTETADIMPAMFNTTSGTDRNTVISVVSDK